MVLLRPVVEAAGIDEQAENLGQAGLVLVEADEPGEPRLRLEVGIGDAALEELVEGRLGAHQKLLTLARSRARPPDE